MERFEHLQQELNALPQIDYERVNDAKNEYLMLLFRQEGEKVLASPEYKAWYDEEKEWLTTYAQFCTERDKTYKPAPQEYYFFVQFLLAKQMHEAHEYARSKRVVLKGDIPIGVHRNGCDVMQEPKYFNLKGSAGAPPDEFSINGQNWGFPTYNWEEMMKDGCQWWVRRFRNMQKYFDAYRIDHVLGFFRIWEIPVHAVHGLLGQFQPALALAKEEIERYGIQMQRELFTRPYITKEILEDIFGPRAAYVRDNFVTPYRDGMYMMREEYDTQRKIQAAITDDEYLRDGLYTLVSNVLFLKDHRDPDLYHPRIAAQQSYVYRVLLSEGEKAAFNRLYDDFYYRRNNDYWKQEAMKKLPRLVEATRMLVCAEDLGMIPECVPTVLNDLRILSLEVQSMPKEPGLQFGLPEHYPYRSVCTIDSHDMPTLRMWWDEDYNRAHNYYTNVLGRHDNAPHPLPAWLARDIMLRNLQSGSMLCILSLQDWLAVSEELRLPDAGAERINIPANPHHYWRYRMHINIDEMMQNHRFCDDIREMIKQAGR
jgi:4-alpha-glucanotransferase